MGYDQGGRRVGCTHHGNVLEECPEAIARLLQRLAPGKAHGVRFGFPKMQQLGPALPHLSLGVPFPIPKMDFGQPWVILDGSDPEPISDDLGGLPGTTQWAGEYRTDTCAA